MKVGLILGVLGLMASILRADDLALTVEPKQEFFVLGEPIQFDVCISNKSARDVSFMFDPLPESALEISSENLQDGLEIEKRLSDLVIGEQVTSTLKPGETYKRSYILSDYLVRIQKSGTFHLNTQVHLLPEDGKRLTTSHLSLSAKLSLTILPPDAQALALKMDALKRGILESPRDRELRLRLLLLYTDPRSVDMAGDIYRLLMPEDEGSMILLAQGNRVLGRKYLEKFDAETPANFSELHQRITQGLAIFAAMEKFQADPASK